MRRWRRFEMVAGSALAAEQIKQYCILGKRGAGVWKLREPMDLLRVVCVVVCVIVFVRAVIVVLAVPICLVLVILFAFVVLVVALGSVIVLVLVIGVAVVAILAVVFLIALVNIVLLLGVGGPRGAPGGCRLRG